MRSCWTLSNKTLQWNSGFFFFFWNRGIIFLSTGRKTPLNKRVGRLYWIIYEWNNRVESQPLYFMLHVILCHIYYGPRLSTPLRTGQILTCFKDAVNFWTGCSSPVTIHTPIVTDSHGVFWVMSAACKFDKYDRKHSSHWEKIPAPGPQTRVGGILQR